VGWLVVDVVAGNALTRFCGDGTVVGTRGDETVGEGRLGNPPGKDRFVVGEETFGLEPGLRLPETLVGALLLLEVLAVVLKDGRDALRPVAVGLIGAWVMLDGPRRGDTVGVDVFIGKVSEMGGVEMDRFNTVDEDGVAVVTLGGME
jgi:hypothetical protein